MSSAPPQLLSDAEATESALASIFESLRDESPAPRLVDAMCYAVMGGGKRLRAGLVLGSARFASCARREELAKSALLGGAMNVSLAFECLHGYSLVHDDLPAMDDSEMRRGRASCHRAFGEATAILAGDALQSLAFSLLVREDTHADGGVRAGLVSDLAAASGVQGMVGGQMLDLEAETRDFSLEETKAMQRMKTGALMRGAVVAGGRVGGGDERLLEVLGRYGECIGRAFQITDDLLDRTSDAEQMGKPTGRDDVQGKASIVGLMGFDAAREEAERLVEESHQILREAASESSFDSASTQAVDYMLDISSFMVNRVY